jgi:hypothetical protein
VPRDANGALLSTAELIALRAQLPETVGGARVLIDSSSTRALWFWSDVTCIMDLEEIILEHAGARMRLVFNLPVLSGRFNSVTINGPPFQSGAFVFDRRPGAACRWLTAGGVAARDSQTNIRSATKPSFTDS